MCIRDRGHSDAIRRIPGVADARQYTVPVPEALEAEMCIRDRYQYNACAMTGRTRGLDEIAGSSFIELHSQDAEALGVADGDRVRVTSRRGQVETTARVSGKTNPGETWMPFHFQDANSNWLTIAALDRVSKAPEYKVCAVRVEKA